MTRLLLAALLLSTGCTPIIKVANGFKNPNRVRTTQQVVDYAERKDMRTDNLLRYPDLPLQDAIKRSGNSVPEVLIFDREGRLVPYGEPGSCNASAFSFLEELDATKKYETEATEIDQILNGLATFEGEPPTLSPDADFHVFLTWASWAGKLNVDHVNVWEQDAAKNTKSNIKVFKVNLDHIP